MKPSAGQEQIEPIKVPWAGSMVLVSTTAAMVLIGVLPQVIRWAESAAAAGLY
jgi:hypothetical protein